ncbi:hypothetical protein CAPTEDRAFT_226025 [Capitella teleta]|uniref:VPS9 domain-containing protein n=1 Tax=Capitella teleta TaxID=283909 RepID=R7TRP6_CAPTE|nr:hypothetical protein CAPTEDRAFT_226025 [Capitella teleta]|eukprot:ELT93705.1 hypothetical protein CAPTEDRAFT_226025 [Capitella teleta]
MASYSAEDDFDFNPFYHSLQSTIFFVPRHSSKGMCAFKREHICNNFLRLINSEYLTTDKQGSGKVSFGGRNLETKEGFPETRNAEILAEETGYNENSRQFRILLLDKPLLGPVSYLVMQEAERKICIFLKNYMILKGFIEDAAQKLNHIYSETYQAFQSHLRLSILQDHRALSNIALSLESFILHCVHDKVSPVLHNQCDTKNSEIVAKLDEIREIPRDILGLRSVLTECSLKSAVSEAMKLSDGVTPVQKMLCIKSIMDKITESVDAFLLSRQGNTQMDDFCLTSDDYIPLLIVVLAEARPNHLASEIFFIEHFHWSENTKDNLEFSFVSLQASVHYILDLDLQKLRSQMKSNSEDVHLPATPSVAMATAASPPKSRRDKRLDRINRMLDKTNRELSLMKMEIGSTQASNGQTSVRGDPILGDFFSSLQGDNLPSCFGKQS